MLTALLALHKAALDAERRRYDARTAGSPARTGAATAIDDPWRVLRPLANRIVAADERSPTMRRDAGRCGAPRCNRDCSLSLGGDGFRTETSARSGNAGRRHCWKVLAVLTENGRKRVALSRDNRQRICQWARYSTGTLAQQTFRDGHDQAARRRNLGSS
jgi:hypothetical protein